jgi:hypothetical protein
VRLADRRFNPTRNDYELNFYQNTTITPVEDTGEVSSDVFSFVRIADISVMFKDTFVDICGAILDVGECVNLTSKAGNEL